MPPYWGRGTQSRRGRGRYRSTETVIVAIVKLTDMAAEVDSL